MTELRYSSFANRIDVDAFEDAIGWEPAERHGDEDAGFCPDLYGMHKHGDTTGKFSINREKRVYNCWVCGGGSLLDLAMVVRDLDEDDAIDWVYQFASEEEDERLEDEIERILADEEEERVEPYFNSMMIEQWEYPDHPWLASRAIVPWVAKEFHIGYNAEARTRNPKTDERYEGPAIILPHFHEGRLVGWQYRWIASKLPEWVRKRKYTNTHDFPRKTTIYGYDQCAQYLADPYEIRSDSFATLDFRKPVKGRWDALAETKPVVVESITSSLAIWSFGWPSVATFGGSVSLEQLKTLRRFVDGVYIAPDNDAVGETWLEGRWKKGRKTFPALTEYLEDYIPVQVIDPPTFKEGADLGDLVDPSAEYPYTDLVDHLMENIRDPE